MNLSDITTKAWILALFKRDDGERFLLGDGYYDFKDSLQHFQPNSMSNDIVELQGADGQLLAGQVRRSGTQSFDGYIGDGTTNRKIVEQRRKAFLMFFRKKHYYTVVYIFCDGTAIKRERGYLVDAPSVPEIRQKSPEYHVALNFENVNYYEYAENAQGEEIYSNVREIVVSNIISGGLVWDALGAVSEALQWSGYTTESGSFITLNDVIQNAPMSLTQIKGNATQQTYSGKNKIDGANPTDANLATASLSDNVITISSTATNTTPYARWVIDNLSANDVVRYSSVIMDSNGQVILQYDNKGSWATITTSAKQYTDGTTPATYSWTNTVGTTKVRFLLYANKTIPTGDSSSRYKNTILTVNNSDLSYEQYVGGIPAPNPQFPMPISTVTGEQTVGVTGKNLATLATSATKTVGGLNFTTDGGYININGTATSNANFYFDSFKLPTNDTATFSIDVSGYTDKPSSNSAVILQSSPDNSNWSSASTIWLLSGDPKSATITLDSSLYYRVRFYVTASSVFTNATIKVQLEKGSATTFEPYQGQSQTIDLGSIELAKIGTYQDYIWNDNGTWKVHKEVGKVVLDGSEAWLATTLTTGTRYFTIKNDIGLRSVNSNGSDIISNYFGGVSYVTYYQAGGVYGISHSNYQSNNYIQLFFAQSIGDSTAIATWLSTHNTTVYYALATPTDTAITQQSLIEQLEHIYQLYGGLNNISIMGAGNGSIEIRYATVLNPGGGFVWEDGGTGGLTTITIDAVDLTLPVWTITGPATNPTLSNITTGQTMSWLGTVPSGQTLIIDMNEQTATMAGANVYAFLSGNWVGLAPGTNRISYSVTGTDEASTLSWNNIVG